MGTHHPDPTDDLVFTHDRAEIRGSSGARHLSRARQTAIEGQAWAKPGAVATARCGTSGWLAAAGEPVPTGLCASCFRGYPNETVDSGYRATKETDE
jgi:hypothetical protein